MKQEVPQSKIFTWKLQGCRKTAPDGFVHNKAEQNVQFVYVDQDTPAVVESVEFINERQKVEISVEKQDAENGSTIAGAEFGLYAKKTSKPGKSDCESR